MDHTKKTVIGITGGIGSGKTVATDALKNLGYYVIDADEVSRKLFARNTVGEQKLCALFPEAANGFTLDRRKLRDIIARDGYERDRLNAFTHPIILRDIKTEIRSADASPIVLSAPLLFETELFRLCDVTVTVTCPEQKRISRISKRDGVSESAAAAIVAAQATDTERAEKADFVIDSDCPVTEFVNRIVECVIKCSYGDNR